MLQNYSTLSRKSLFLLFVQQISKLPNEGNYLAGAHFYCCVCQVYIHYTIDELNAVKSDEQKLTRFYKNVLKDLEEIKKVESDINFLDEEVEFKFRNRQTGEESWSYLRDLIEFLYNSVQCKYYNWLLML